MFSCWKLVLCILMDQRSTGSCGGILYVLRRPQITCQTPKRQPISGEGFGKPSCNPICFFIEVSRKCLQCTLQFSVCEQIIDPQISKLNAIPGVIPGNSIGSTINTITICVCVESCPSSWASLKWITSYVKLHIFPSTQVTSKICLINEKLGLFPNPIYQIQDISWLNSE